MLRQGSETLAGRIFYHYLHGFSFDEVGIEQHSRLWLRGGFPRSYLSRSHSDSHEWRREFVRTFLERDLPQLGITIRSTTLHRFWTMLAHYHGQIWNASEFARSFGVADTTIRNYVDLLTSALVVRQLLPWHENIAKRQIKSPKVYLSDSGILHSLLNFFWATHGGAELDLLIIRGRKRMGFEVKRTSSPQLTPSMRNAFSDLRLKSLEVIHAGDHTFPLTERVRAVALARLLDDLQPLR